MDCQFEINLEAVRRERSHLQPCYQLLQQKTKQVNKRSQQVQWFLELRISWNCTMGALGNQWALYFLACKPLQTHSRLPQSSHQGKYW
jgi:hypothetical protein